MPDPYYSDDLVTLYHGDCREVLPALGVKADCIIADPPYGETSLAWDRWPHGWLDVAADVTRSLWCFGSLRMFMRHRDEFAGWNLSQDLIWEKQQSPTLTTDRFAKVHEQPAHWYRGPWRALYRDTPREQHYGSRQNHFGYTAPDSDGVHGNQKRRGAITDNGTRPLRSVLRVNNLRNGNQAGIHPTEKPVGLLDPLITYACPPGGLVVAPFAGSGSDLDAARASGRRAVGVEANERYCELAARRLSQGVLVAS